MKNIKPMETFLGLYMFCFGVILLNPTDTFSLSISYTAMQAFATELQWGLLCTIAGASLVLTSFLGTNTFTVLSIAVVTFIFSFIGSMFFVSSLETHVPSTGICYLVTAVFSLYCAYKVGGNK